MPLTTSDIEQLFKYLLVVSVSSVKNIYLSLLPIVQLYYLRFFASMCMLSRFSPVWLFVTLWTVVCQASLSMGFSRQEYWSGLPCPAPVDHPDRETEAMSHAACTDRQVLYQ